MNENKESVEVKTKNLTSSSVIAWGLGIVIGLSALGMIFTQPIAGILMLLASLVMLPPTYRFFKTKTRMSLSRPLRVIVVLALMALSGFQLTGDTSVDSSYTPKADKVVAEEKAPVEPPMQVTSNKLVEDYKANEVSADAKYKGKTVEITGTVETIGKDILDNPYITFFYQEYSIINNVQCLFARSDSPQLENLSKGQRLTVIGDVSGIPGVGNILVRNCKIKD
jgi:hypothetical protein